jgi:hypothetical protein
MKANQWIKNNKVASIVLAIALILFICNFIDGEGSKAADQKKTASTNYTCSKDSDCPQCVGTGLNLSMESKCTNQQCVLPQTCFKYDCGNQTDCKSVRNTVLDNIVSWLSNNPWILVGLIILAIIYWQLR